MNVEHIIDMARQAGASDVHLVCGLPVKFRLAGRLENAGVDGDAPLSHDDCEQLARRLAGDDFDRIQRIGELATSASAGSVTMDNALIALARNRDITSQTAIDAAHDVDYVRKSVR